MITVAVAKVPWENIISVSLRRNPWNKVLSKPFRITETSNRSRRGQLCRFHKNLSIVLLAILGDPGAEPGGKGKSKRAKENGDEEKHSRARRAPGDKFLPDQSQTAEVILNSDWCQKFFVFFCPIRGQQAVKSFRVFLHGNHLIVILALVRLARFCSKRKVSITAQNIQGIVRNIGGEIRWTFRRYWYSSVFPSVRDLFKDVLTD